MKARIITLFFALFAAVLGMKATDALTGFKITVSENGRTPHTEALPASKMPAIDLTDEATTSLTITGAEVSATGNVSNVQVVGSVYKQGNTPEEWRGIPLVNQGNGVWSISGISADLIDEGMGSTPRVFEFYVSAKDGSNNTIYYNNGGENYKVLFTPAGSSDAITSLNLRVRVNNGESFEQSFPASGFDPLDITDVETTSILLERIKATTGGNISDVQIYGTVYKQGKSPEGWMGFPLTQEESGVWRLEMNRDLIEEGMGEDIRVFEFYASATDGNNSTVYYNNGGNNYKIIFKPQAGGGGGGDDWKVKFYGENTASITLNFKNNDQSYSYSGTGQRDPGTSQQPGGLSSLTIKGFDISFIYNTDANVEISDVSLQYMVYEDGGYGEWNRIDVTNTQTETVYNPDEGVWENRMICKTTNLNIDATSGLKPGKNYNLQIMYQIVTTNGDYIMFLQNKETSIFRFSLSTSGVDSIKATGKKKKSVRYDLNGRELTGKPASGFYIEDGKKYIAQ